MVKKIPELTGLPKERAYLVGVELKGSDNVLSLDESIAELSLLAETAGLDVVGQATQKLAIPYVQTFIGPGKIEEIKALIGEQKADVLVFDNELSPRHLRELENEFGEDLQILDRTALILDIFAQHAHTNEGALQVELAQYEYRLPRLTRAWTHLARQSGGGGGRAGSIGGVGLRGPGETQLEVDRRVIRRRIAQLKAQIEKVRIHRQQYRVRRKQSRIPVVALVGYTNAGKSTLLNTLSDAGIFVADQLFATLDPTTRRIELPGGHVCLFTDTVGFIQKLPTTLVSAFRATLEEISEADLLLHIVDVTHPNAQAQAKIVHQTLNEIKANQIQMITVLNKIDRLEHPEQAKQILQEYPKSVAISALTGDGINDLLMKVEEQLYESLLPISVLLPYQEGALIAQFHELGQIDLIEHIQSGVKIKGRLPGRLLALYKNFVLK